MVSSPRLLAAYAAYAVVCDAFRHAPRRHRRVQHCAELNDGEGWSRADAKIKQRPIPRHRRLANKQASRKQSERLKPGEKGTPTKLRVIAGTARGRKLESPETLLRPMMGKVREALFSTLVSLGVFRAPRQVRHMDAFCGSGSVGVEALSRGGAGCVFVDLSPDACAVAARNAETCGFAGKYETCPRDVAAALNDEALRGPGLDLLTLTPPYEEVDYDDLMASVAASPLLNADCVVVVEYPVERGKPPFRIGELVGVRNRRYGRTALAFYAFKPSGALEALRPRPEEFEEFS
jgi:16S rRNA (guanine966-N2)-methyltransferase